MDDAEVAQQVFACKRIAERLEKVADETNDKLRAVLSRIDLIESALNKRPVRYDSNLMTVAEAAKEYRISKAKLYAMKQVHVKIGRMVRISRELMERQ